MEQEKLKAAVVGLSKAGIEVLEVINDSKYFELTAVADSDGELAENTARTYECNGYYDYRQLIIQNQLDIVIVTEPIHISSELIRSAMGNKCHVIKLSPAGLDFEQTLELSRLSNKNNVKFAVASGIRFSEGFKHLRKFIHSEGKENFHLISAVCMVDGKVELPENRWLTDPSIAGGGAVLHDAYGIIDQITLNFNIPEKVYSLNINNSPDKQQRLSKTEDAAVITMHFSDTQMASVTASRIFGPHQESIKLHMKDKFVTASTNSFVLSDNSGEVITELHYDSDRRQWMEEMFADFALSIIEPNKHNVFADPKNDLLTMAVIQASYLSAKTSMPEEPARIMDIAGA